MQTQLVRPYVFEVGRLELRRVCGARTVRLLPLLIALLALWPLLLRAGQHAPAPLGPLLLLTLLALQAILAPLIGGAVTSSCPARHRGMQLLLLLPAGADRYLVGVYLTRVALLLSLSLIPLPVWLFGSAGFPEASFSLDFWLVLLAGPFVFAAMALFTGQTTRSEVLGFLLYGSLLACAAFYLWGLRVAQELAEFRPLVLLFLLWLSWAALTLARLHIVSSLASAPEIGPPEAVHHTLGSTARRLAKLVRGLWPGSFEDPLLYLLLYRPPAPAIGLSILVTGWLIFVALVLDTAFAILPYRLVEPDRESLQTHLWLVTAGVLGVLLTPAALAMASFQGRTRVHALLRLTPYRDVDHFRARERSVLALSLPLCLLPTTLQLAFTLSPWSAIQLGLLCVTGQLLALQAAFLFCGVKNLAEGLLWILGAAGLLFVALPALGRPLLQPAPLWARETLREAGSLSLPLSLSLQAVMAALLARYHRLRFRVPA